MTKEREDRELCGQNTYMSEDLGLEQSWDEKMALGNQRGWVRACVGMRRQMSGVAAVLACCGALTLPAGVQKVLRGTCLCQLGLGSSSGRDSG